MKKTLLTIAIVLGIAFSGIAQNRGLFDRGPVGGYDNDSYNRDTESPLFGLPGQHGLDQDQSTPLGGGALLLIGFGAAYALKRRKK